jgi:hypothetical protein
MMISKLNNIFVINSHPLPVIIIIISLIHSEPPHLTLKLNIKIQILHNLSHSIHSKAITVSPNQQINLNEN